MIQECVTINQVSPLTKCCLGENDRAPRVSHESLQFGKSYSYSGFMRQSRVMYNIGVIYYVFLLCFLTYNPAVTGWKLTCITSGVTGHCLGTESKLIRGDEKDLAFAPRMKTCPLAAFTQLTFVCPPRPGFRYIFI